MIVKPGPLPPDPRLWPRGYVIAGRPWNLGRWLHDEDPNVVPWQATHRILWRDGEGKAGHSDVMFIRDNQGSCDWQGHPRDQCWLGYEREQWHPTGLTAWAYVADRGYLDASRAPFRVRRTDSAVRSDLVLVKLGPDGEPIKPG